MSKALTTHQLFYFRAILLVFKHRPNIEDSCFSIVNFNSSLLLRNAKFILFYSNLFNIIKIIFSVALKKVCSCMFWKPDRKSTRLNSSHVRISYAVFCLKKKKKKKL